MLGKLFGFNPKETTVRTEIMAGITTFLTMAYILAVNPNILGETGMDKGALFTTTVLMAALPTIFMALYAKLPLALAPGMGLNAFFAYTVCLIMGYSWQFALTAVFLEGLAFILLTITNLREKIVDVIPPALKTAISAGIGLYIAFIGLKNAEVIVDNPATLVCLGKLTSGSGLLGIIGIAITSILLVRNIKGALLIGILATTIIGIPMGIISATKQYSIFDRFATVAALIGFSTPNFWLSIMLILVFSVNLQWLPVSAAGTILHLVLPSIALGLQSAAVFTRMTRSSMLEVLNMDYIRTARAKGLNERIVIFLEAYHVIAK